MKIVSSSRVIARTLIVSAALALSACASAPPAPTDALQAAEAAISRAEEARVADYASVELSQARDKLVAARTESQKEEPNMDRARQLATEAKLDAELATAKAEAARAKNVNAEMQKNIETLRQETQRKVSP